LRFLLRRSVISTIRPRERMFAAYPPSSSNTRQQHRPQPIARHVYWRLLLPLCLAGFICIVCYANFVTAADKGLENDAPGLKRMHPFLASPGYEIGFWTRQRDTSTAGLEVAGRSPAAAGSQVLELQQQLEAERARTAAQQVEIGRLRGFASSQAVVPE
ncbi:unnamed protein product, partial [Polarella glacialis]